MSYECSYIAIIDLYLCGGCDNPSVVDMFCNSIFYIGSSVEEKEMYYLSPKTLMVTIP